MIVDATGPIPTEDLRRVAAAHPYALLFATVSGSHIYGFPSPDSDFDLRGVHVLPLPEVIGLATPDETIEQGAFRAGLEMDLVTHDVAKFCRLLLKPNGYVLEQLMSPLVIQTSSEHQELKAMAHVLITRYHARHYEGFFHSQWKLFQRDEPRKVKPLLYCYRVLMTGIHLMRRSDLEPNLAILAEEYGLRYIPDLIERKRAGGEHGTLGGADFAFHERELHRLLEELRDEADRSYLPEEPLCRDDMNDFLLRVRMKFGE